MKKVYTLASVFLMSIALHAQVQKVGVEPVIDAEQKTVGNNITRHIRSSSGPSTPESVVTIWSDDFSTPTNWTFTGGIGEWDIVTSLAPTLIVQNFDSVINSTSGGNFALIDSDVEGQSGTQDAYLEYNGSIDCSSYPGVRLIFKTYFRQYLETREVLVSNDGGANWDTYQVLTQFGTNTNSPNAYTEVVDISASAAGQANVMIKFHYVGAWDWFWAVDDVTFTSIPNNDLTLDEVYNHSTFDSNNTKYYSQIPMFQSIQDSVLFTGMITNTGLVTQTNVVLHNEITSPISSVTLSSNATAIVPGGSDSVTLNGTFKLGMEGTGTYTWDFYMTSDSTDEFPDEDSIFIDIEVTDTTYARDRNPGGGGTWGAAYEVGPSFELFDTAKVTSITAGFGSTTPAGSIVSLRVYDGGFNLIVSREFIELTANEIGQLASFSIPETVLEPGIYIVTMATFTDSVRFMRDNAGDASPSTIFVDPDQSGTWFWTTAIPAIRLNISNDLFVCNLEVLASQLGNNTAITTVSNGTEPYTYLWSNSDTTDTISGVASGMTYMVTVTDADGCEATAEVDIISGVGEIGKELISIYPNPNNGEFQVELTNVESGEYQIIVRNVLSQIISTKTIMVNSNFKGNMRLSGVEKGMYFMEIRNAEGQVSVTQFVIE